MNPAWIITGIILFVGMAAAGISLSLKRRKESQVFGSFEDVQARPDSVGHKKDES